MQVSLNWLRRYVDLPADPRGIAAALTALGFEVEALKIAGEGVTGVVVGEVKARAKHPEADKLSVCQVFDGERELQVVCGAPNVAAGQKVLFAKVGARLPGDFHIKKAKLRGVESLGMICAEDEVGLGESHDGILVLPAHAEPGVLMQDLPGLCDTRFEINVTPNRPDALSHIGLARELAAHYGLALNYPRVDKMESGLPVEDAIALQVLDGEASPHYVGRVIDGVTVRESPPWLQAALRSAGKNPINNVVDVTNFVLLEWGQPSHAFDLDALAGSRIVVRKAGAGETLTTLDGMERALSPRDTVIADAQRPQVLAGVMGGMHSGVSTATKRLFVEVAYFQPAMVRLQARRHGLSSDSSYRFERGVDYLRTAEIADYLAGLLVSVCGGEIRRGRVEFRSPSHPKHGPVIALRPERLRRHLGLEVADGEISRLLAGIGLVEEGPEEVGPRNAPEVLRFRIPGFRGDLTREADLVEEVARLSDYNKIPALLPRLPLGAGSMPPREVLARKIRHTLRDLGLQEAMNLRFTSRKQLARLGLQPDDPRLHPILLQNPLSEDWEAMPTTGLPNLLQALAYNQNNQQSHACLFEVGKAFFPRAKGNDPRDNGVKEEAMLTLALMGEWPSQAWDRAGTIDFYTAKGIMENLLQRLGYRLAMKGLKNEAFLHPKESLVLLGEQGGKTLRVGVLGLLHPKSQQAFGLRQPVIVAELSLDALLALNAESPRFQPFSTQVASLRDFNALVPDSLEYGELVALLPKSPLRESLRLRSIYRGQGIPEGHKAMHFEVVYRHADRSLTDEEVQVAHEDAKAALALDGRIRFK